MRLLSKGSVFVTGLPSFWTWMGTRKSGRALTHERCCSLMPEIGLVPAGFETEEGRSFSTAAGVSGKRWRTRSCCPSRACTSSSRPSASDTLLPNARRAMCGTTARGSSARRVSRSNSS